MARLGLAVPGSIGEKIALIGIAIHDFAWVLLGLEVALQRRPAVAREV